jgi:phosphoenolpyruvate synthase/pyruvate phosphate dikinase
MLKTLEHVRRSDAGQCGPKSACLGELLARGYAVPASIVLPTSVFEMFLANSGLEPLIGSYAEESGEAHPARLVAIERDIRARFDAVELPDDVRHEIEAWTRHRTGPFAVRSSATNEDLPGATFAGQYDSFLMIDTHDISRMVRRCFASLFNARAAVYRRRKGIRAIGSMAVLVQTMVPCVHAGIVYTQAPGRPDMLLVECTVGLGDVVASGSVTPNRYYLNRSTLEIEEAREQHPMNIASVRAASRAALSIERHFGGPQDVEYGVAAKDDQDAEDDRAGGMGGVYILQARPISAATFAAAGSIQR